MKINNLGMREISEKEATELGIDLTMIKVCRRFRHLAKLDRLRIDMTEHRSGLNKHLFGYIEYCGMEPLDFVRQYLSNLQPYMIERRKDQEKEKTFLCVIDNLYRISVYIKVDTSFGEELVVSFHEDNIRGIAKSNSLIKNKNNRLVPVFADSYGSINKENGNVSLNVFVQRGMRVLPLSMIGFCCKDVFIVRESDITQQFLDYCNQYIRDLYTSDLNLDFDQVNIFSMLQQISFTSYGRDVFSSISLLIDSLVIQTDANSKQVADFALITFVQSLNLTDNQRHELISLLDDKYKVSSIMAIGDILYRVKTILCNSETEDMLGKQDEFEELSIFKSK